MRTITRHSTSGLINTTRSVPTGLHVDVRRNGLDLVIIPDSANPDPEEAGEVSLELGVTATAQLMRLCWSFFDQNGYDPQAVLSDDRDWLMPAALATDHDHPLPRSWAEVFKQAEAQGQNSLAIVFDGSKGAAEMAAVLNGADEAEWKATTLQPHPSGGLVVGVAVTPRVVEGGGA